MGHGAGQKYISSKDLTSIQNLNNLVILMGCSSGKLLNYKN